MPFQPTLFHSRIYRDFKGIEASEHKHIIRFYERYEQKILALEFEEYFEMALRYANALFEAGEYKKHLKIADHIIETSILQNIQTVDGQEIYRSTLFKKAASYYNILAYQHATHILCELVKMEPDNEINARFLEKCMERQNPQLLQYSKAGSIFLLLIAALTVCVELLFVRHFYPQYLRNVELFRNILFLSGCLNLVQGKIMHYWFVRRKVHKLVRIAKTNKISGAEAWASSDAGY